MIIFSDTHIHSALSPCASHDMTPNNIVNRAVCNRLNLISVTDHNSVLNCRPVHECAKKSDLMFIPGMELETSEEIHMICLFKDLDSAYEMQDYVWKRLPEIKNRKDIYGEQFVFDDRDNVIDEVDKLLLAPADIDVYSAIEIVNDLKGIIYPAHINRDSYSIITNLGSIPIDLNIEYVEATCNDMYNGIYDKYQVIYSSDAHSLERILASDNCNIAFPHKVYEHFFKGG